MENDRIFVNASYMADSVEVHWAAALEGITSRGDRPDYDGEFLLHMDGRATMKWWDGPEGNERPFVLVIDPGRSSQSGAYVTIYETEDQPPDEDAQIVWRSTEWEEVG